MVGVHFFIHFFAKRIEVGEHAARIIKIIEASKSVTGRQYRQLKQMSVTVQSIVRSKVLDKEVNPEEFEKFVKALNTKVTFPPPAPFNYGLKTQELIRNPPGRVFTVRGLADALNGYLQCFVETPDLEKHNPLGLCSRPECQALFLKSRSDQEFCADVCRVTHWNKKKKQGNLGIGRMHKSGPGRKEKSEGGEQQRPNRNF
jgi:hypothetical protein